MTRNKQGNIHIVLFWHMNDWGKYGRAYEKIAENLSSLSSIKKVLCVFPPRWLGYSRLLQPFLLSKLSKKLFLLTINAQLIPSGSHRSRLILRIKGTISKFVLGQLLKSMGFKKQNTILWLFPPHQFINQLLRLIPHHLLVTQLADNNTFREDDSEARISFAKKQYGTLTMRSDMIITSSQLNYRLFHSQNPNCYLFENGLDPIFVSCPSKLPYLRNHARPCLGYVGFISQRTDIKLLDYIARARPEYDLIIAGPQEEKLNEYGTLNLPNVTYAGVIPYKELPRLLSNIDVCLMPHKDTPYSNSMSPLKLLQYLGTGRPIVSTPVDGAKRWDGLISIANDYQDFLKKIDTALNEDHENLSSKRIEAAKLETWEKWVGDVFEVVVRHFKERKAY
ncbi:MAG: glycosyltransferase [Candidatus Omnitrophota bacterium]